MEKKHTLIAIGEHVLLAGLVVIMANAAGIMLEYSVAFFLGFVVMSGLAIGYYMKQRPSDYILFSKAREKPMLPEETVRKASFGGLAIFLLAIVVIGISAVPIYGHALHRQLVLAYKYDFWAFYLSVHFGLCGLVMLFILQFALRISTLRLQTWNRFTDNWLRFSGISAIAVGGFGFVAAFQDSTTLMNITVLPDFVDVRFMTIVYITAILLYAAAGWCGTMGRRASPDPGKGIQPYTWFIPAFMLAWTANWAIYTLFIDSIMLTLHAHVTG